MIERNRMASRVLFLALCLLAVHAGFTAREVRAQIASIGITRTVDLNFGQLVAGFSAGTVTVTPAGSRSATGGALLGNGAAVSAASFTVSGEPLATYAITLPASSTLTNGVQTMTLDDFTSTPATTGSLSGAGSQTLTVGARLQVGAGQASGAYTGSFNVRVDYN